VLYRTLIEKFRTFLSKLAFFVFFGCFSCDRPTGQELRFSTSPSLPSIRGRANGVPTWKRLFVRLTVSAVEVPKVDRFSILLVTEPWVTAYVFGSNYAFCLIAQCLAVCPFAGSFCATYRFGVTRLTIHPRHAIYPTTFSADLTF